MVYNKKYTVKLKKEDVRKYLERYQSEKNISFTQFLCQEYDQRMERRRKIILSVVLAACIVILAPVTVTFLNTRDPDSITVDVAAVQDTDTSAEEYDAGVQTERVENNQTRPAVTGTDEYTAEMNRTEQEAVSETIVQQTESPEIQYGNIKIDNYFLTGEYDARLINATKSPYYLYLDGEKIGGNILPDDLTSFEGAIEAGEHTIYVESGVTVSKSFTLNVDPECELNLYEFELEVGIINPELRKR